MKGSSTPRICATLALTTMERLRLAAKTAISQGADLIEIRLDHLQEIPGPEEIIWCTDLGVPTVVTIRNQSDGGRYNGTETGRLDILCAFAGICHYIDLEFRSATWELVATLRKRGSMVIISHHDFSSTPSLDELVSIISRAKALGGDVYKIAALVNSPDDTLRLLSLPRIISPVVVVPMGRNGRIGRILAPLFGSEFAYAHPEGLPAVAPGMLSIKEMRRVYRYLLETLNQGDSK